MVTMAGAEFQLGSAATLSLNPYLSWEDHYFGSISPPPYLLTVADMNLPLVYNYLFNYLIGWDWCSSVGTRAANRE